MDRELTQHVALAFDVFMISRVLAFCFVEQWRAALSICLDRLIISGLAISVATGFALLRAAQMRWDGGQ